MVPAAKNEAKLNFPVTDEPQMGECYNYLATKKAIGFAKAFAKFYIKSPEAMEGFEKTEEPFEISVGNDTMIISRKVYEDYEAKTFRESEEAKNKLIDCAKEFLSKNLSYCIYDWSVLKEANDYVNYGEFCNEVDSIAFRVINRYVSKKLVDDAVERGNLYMFEISSLDMYKDSSRMKNIMALRFNQIMNGMFTGDKSIIINNAPNFGLSAMPQLRRRVGRSNKKAFCYLLTPPLRELTVDARRRLQAIESFSELGSGIHIAMQDLDIRGAGNLLGAEQSGFIADLGYETYQKILREAVQELKEDEFSDLYAETNDDEPENFSPDCQIESDLELLFPNDYIPGASERISLYQELDNMEKESDIQAFAERLRDRFGRIPHEGEELIRVVSLRRMAKQLGMEKVVLKQGKMILHFISDEPTRYFQSPAFGKILAYLQKYPRRCQLREIKGKRSMVVGQVDTVKCGMEILQEILNLDAA